MKLKLDEVLSIARGSKQFKEHMYLFLPTKRKCGSYGSYIKLSDQVGIKILHYGRPTKDELMASEIWRNAVREQQNLTEARKRLKTLVPKVYKVVPMRVAMFTGHFDSDKRKNTRRLEYTWRPVIVVQHIEGRHKSGRDFDEYSLRPRLEKERVYHGDLHNMNVLYKKNNRPVIVDWGGYVSFNN